MECGQVQKVQILSQLFGKMMFSVLAVVVKHKETQRVSLVTESRISDRLTGKKEVHENMHHHTSPANTRTYASVSQKIKKKKKRE